MRASLAFSLSLGGLLATITCLWIQPDGIFWLASLLLLGLVLWTYRAWHQEQQDQIFENSYLRLSKGVDSKLLKTLWTSWVSQHYDQLLPLLNAMEPLDHTPHPSLPSSRMLFMMGTYRPFRRQMRLSLEDGHLQWQDGSTLSSHGKLALTACLKGFFDLKPLKVFQHRTQQDQFLIELKYHTSTANGNGDFSLEMILKPPHGAWIVDGHLSQEPLSLYLS